MKDVPLSIRGKNDASSHVRLAVARDLAAQLESAEQKRDEHYAELQRAQGIIDRLKASREKILTRHCTQPQPVGDSACDCCAHHWFALGEGDEPPPITRPEELSAKEQAASDILLALVTLKRYKDTIGKDAHYEKAQPETWKLANEYLQYAMPEQYAEIEDGIAALAPSPQLAREPKS